MSLSSFLSGEHFYNSLNKGMSYEIQYSMDNYLELDVRLQSPEYLDAFIDDILHFLCTNPFSNSIKAQVTLQVFPERSSTYDIGCLHEYIARVFSDQYMNEKVGIAIVNDNKYLRYLASILPVNVYSYATINGMATPVLPEVCYNSFYFHDPYVRYELTINTFFTATFYQKKPRSYFKCVKRISRLA